MPQVSPTPFDGPPEDEDEDEDRGPHPSFIDVRGVFFRCAEYDTPVWSRPNDADGRWHVADSKSSVQYWSYAPETAWAEMLRRQGIRDAEDVVEMRSRVWAAQVEFTAIADLTDQDWLDWFGIDATDLIADDWAVCQATAASLRRCGASGVVSVSAALPDHLNLTLFKRMVRGDWIETVEGSAVGLRFPELVLPTRLVARGHPDPDLVHRVNYVASLPS